MADDDGAAIDPRYDPAFQRGFEGEVATGPRGRSTLRRTAAVNPAPMRPATQPLDEYGSTPAEGVAESPETAALAGPSVGGAATPSEAVPDAVTTPRELVRNPFVIILMALGALLIIVGAVWAYEGFATIVKNGGTRNEVEFWAAQTMSFGAPLTIVVGVGIAAVVLVMFGRSWQRSRA
jgi:hypothetical protein